MGGLLLTSPLGAYRPGMRRVGQAAWVALGGVLVISCAVESLTVAETDLVVTVENPDANYSSYRTYALSDTVTDLCSVDPDLGLGGFSGLGGSSLGGRSGDDLPDLTCDPIAGRLDDDILDAIAENMEARGYQRVGVDEEPDLAVLVGAVVRDEWYYLPAYAWCDPYYYYYCWYPTTGYVYQFSTGSILINVIDGASTSDEVDSVWFAGLRGLYETSSEATGPERIREMVDRAFAQSPYLDAGGGP